MVIGADYSEACRRRKEFVLGELAIDTRGQFITSYRSWSILSLEILWQRGCT